MRHREVVIDFQRIVQVVPCALTILSREGRILFVNAQTETMFGYGWEELLHQSVMLLISDRCRTALAEYLACCVSPPFSPPPEVMWYGRCKNGSDFPLELSLSPVDTTDGV